MDSLEIARRISEQTYSVSQTTLELFASIMVRHELKKGARWLNEGEIAREIGFVGEGMVRQFYFKNKKEMTEHFACEGTVFLCIESFLRQQPSSLIVEALEPTVIFGIPHDPILSLCAHNFEMEQLYRGMLENSLILSQNKADSLRFESAGERYVRLLKEHPEIVQRAPLSCIASYLQMTPETLSRVRASL